MSGADTPTSTGGRSIGPGSATKGNTDSAVKGTAGSAVKGTAGSAVKEILGLL